jgi:site-specific recombinase XerD
MARKDAEFCLDGDAVGSELVVLSDPDGSDKAPSSVTQDQLGAERLLAVMESYVRYYASGSGHTARAKRYDLQYFLQYLADEANSQIELLTVDDWTYQRTRDYVDSRLSRGEAPATVSRRLATVKHFGRTLAERVPGFINPAREVKSPVMTPARPDGLSPEDVGLLLKAADQMLIESSHGFNALRNRFLLRLLLATGLRADEVRLLVMSQVADDLRWLKNVRTKGRKFRNVYLDSGIRDDVGQYFSARTELLNKKYPELKELTLPELGRYPVLISTYDADPARPGSLALSPKTVWRAIAQIGKKAQALSSDDIPNLHPHTLRHTFAHGLLDSSKDVRLVAQALGHSDVRITMRYTERTDEQIAKAMERRRVHSAAK